MVTRLVLLRLALRSATQVEKCLAPTGDADDLERLTKHDRPPPASEDPFGRGHWRLVRTLQNVQYDRRGRPRRVQSEGVQGVCVRGGGEGSGDYSPPQPPARRSNRLKSVSATNPRSRIGSRTSHTPSAATAAKRVNAFCANLTRREKHSLLALRVYAPPLQHHLHAVKHTLCCRERRHRRRHGPVTRDGAAQRIELFDQLALAMEVERRPAPSEGGAEPMCVLAQVCMGLNTLANLPIKQLRALAQRRCFWDARRHVSREDHVAADIIAVALIAHRCTWPKQTTARVISSRKEHGVLRRDSTHARRHRVCAA